MQTAAPLVMQGVSALAGAFSGQDTPGNLSNQLADTMHRASEAGRNGVVYAGEFDPAPNSTPDFGKPTWEPDLERNAQTLEHRPGDNAGVVRMQNMLAEHEPFGRERIERERGAAVPVAAQGNSARQFTGSTKGTDWGGSGHSQNPGDLSDERYGDQGARPVRSNNDFMERVRTAAGYVADKLENSYDRVEGVVNDAVANTAETVLPPAVRIAGGILHPLGYGESAGEFKGEVSHELLDIDPDEKPEDRKKKEENQKREQAMAVRLPRKVMALLEELKDLPQAQRLEIIKSEFKPSELLGEPGIMDPMVDIEDVLQKSVDMNIFEFKHAYQKGGDYDFKKKGHREYENFGNYVYGMACAARGLDLETAERAAGYAQGKDHTTRSEWGNFLSGRPYGDDPKDQSWIQRGFNKWHLQQRGK